MKEPQIDALARVAPGAVIVGDVSLCEGSSVWYNAVLRGDKESIRVGAHSNIQECCVLHVDRGRPLVLGEGVTVGHGAILHGCTIGDNTLIGMGAIVLNGAEIGNNCIVAAGALVTQGMKAPDGSLLIGSPAKIRRPLTGEERAENRASAEEYQNLSAALF